MELEVVSASGQTLRCKIKNLYIPAFLGKAGILEHHLPYISILNYGEVSYMDLNDQSHYLYIEGGVIEVNDNEIVIITDLIEKGEDIVKAEVEAKLKELSQQIESSKKGAISPEELDQALIQELKFKIKSEITKKLAKS